MKILMGWSNEPKCNFFQNDPFLLACGTYSPGFLSSSVAATPALPFLQLPPPVTEHSEVLQYWAWFPLLFLLFSLKLTVLYAKTMLYADTMISPAWPSPPTTDYLQSIVYQYFLAYLKYIEFIVSNTDLMICPLPQIWVYSSVSHLSKWHHHSSSYTRQESKHHHISFP